MNIVDTMDVVTQKSATTYTVLDKVCMDVSILKLVFAFIVIYEA